MLYRFNDNKKVLPIIGGTGSEFVTINGKIKNEYMDDLPIVINELGELTVNIMFLNELKLHRVIDIVVTHFKFMEHLSIDQLKEVVAFPIDGNNSNTHPGNLGYRFKQGQLEYKENLGYYYVPGFPRRAINSKGELLSTLSGNPLTWYITKPQSYKNISGGYYTNRVEVDGKARTMLRHRAMLMTFREYPDNCDKLLTNHINGIPGDDELDNLEWVDHKRNLDHGYKTNLRSQNKPVLARNIFTGKETLFYSVAECGRELKINDRSINFKLEKAKFGSVCKEGYQFKYLNDDRDWIIPTNPQEEIEKCLFNQKVLIKDTTDSTEKQCKSISMASILTGVTTYRISKALKNDSKEPIDEYIFLAVE